MIDLDLIDDQHIPRLRRHLMVPVSVGNDTIGIPYTARAFLTDCNPKSVPPLGVEYNGQHQFKDIHDFLNSYLNSEFAKTNADDGMICRDTKIREPYEHVHTIKVKSAYVGQKLIQYLVDKFPYHNNKVWADRINCGLVTINGTKVHKGHLIKENDIIYHRNIGVIEPSVPSHIRVLGYNEDYLMVDKPSPIPMHSGGRYHRNTVVNMLAEMGHDQLKVVHRLDSVTSGIVVFARNAIAAKQFGVVLSRGNIEKTYEAIVSGHPGSKEVLIDMPIRRKKGFIFECSRSHDSKSAMTRFQVLEYGDGWARVGCNPVTGRTHQIRLHLREWGHPVWDDMIYNGESGSSISSLPVQKRGISLVSMGIKINPDKSLLSDRSS